MDGSAQDDHRRAMTTLHLEVTVTDVATFTASFAANSELRRQAGVRAEQVRHPVGDDCRLLVDLDFDSVAEAESFLVILKEKIWKEAPALVGTPSATILEPLVLA